MKDWSAEFNALPRNVRRIGQAMECLTRIQHLKMERERLKRSYRRNCQEINAHIHNCEDSLIGYSRQWAKLKEREINDVQRDNGIYPIDIPVRIGTFDQERTP